MLYKPRFEAIYRTRTDEIDILTMISVIIMTTIILFVSVGRYICRSGQVTMKYAYYVYIDIGLA